MYPKNHVGVLTIKLFIILGPSHIRKQKVKIVAGFPLRRNLYLIQWTLKVKLLPPVAMLDKIPKKNSLGKSWTFF